MTDPTNDFPDSPRPKKHRQSLRLIVNLILLSVFVLAVNYISCSRYERKDLTQDMRYTLSSQTLKLLSSQKMSERETPVKIIFAFLRNTDNYTRMRSLLEDYTRYSDGKVELECVDPIRSPNRAREISNTYGIEFSQNMVIIDARPNTEKSLTQSDDDINVASHVRFCPGSTFVKYDTLGGKKQRAVALQMEDVITYSLEGAMDGIPRNMYLIVDKSKLGREDRNDPTSLFATIEKLARELNVQLIPTRISETQQIPENAAGVMLVGPQYDLLPRETAVLEEYWNRKASGVFVMLDPSAGPLPNVFRMLRENGIRPRTDRIMKKDSGRAIYEINAIFSPGPAFTSDFWNSSTMLEGQTSSMKVEEGDERLSAMRINPFPLLEAGSGYYGETKFDAPNPQFDPREDYAEELSIAAAVERGSIDLARSKDTSRMTVITNMDMLSPQKVRPDQRDFLKSCLFWITDREELAGIGTRNDDTIKIDWNEQTKSFIELFVTILLPLFALLIAFFLWRSRRA